jgi:membrane-associated phospholipid phosphatase
MRILFITISFFCSLQLVQSQTLETKWLHSIENQNEFQGASKFLSNTTDLFSIAVPISFLIDGYLTKNEEIIKSGWYIGTSMVISEILTFSSKKIFNRERPFEKYEGYIIKYGYGGSESFPSGHTSIAFSTATSLSIAYPKWYVIVPSMLWASSVAFSRMNLGVHYPSDVFAGALLGAGSAWLTYKLNRWLNKPIDRFSKKTAYMLY